MVEKSLPKTLLLCALICAGLGSAATPGAETAVPIRDQYQINPGDVLQISVWKEEDLKRELLVNPDGHFAFPLAGDMVAEGKTVEQVRQELTEKLSKFIPDLVVTVAALPNGNKVYVVGQVARPGEYPMIRNVDVMQAISMAGGTTPFAKLDDVKILRRGSQGSQIAIPFRYGPVQEGNKLEQNILLRAGDTVVVP